MTRAQKQVVDQKENAIVMSPLTESEIAERAYALFLSRGGVDGADLEDWLQAERELLREKSGIEAA